MVVILWAGEGKGKSSYITSEIQLTRFLVAPTAAAAVAAATTAAVASGAATASAAYNSNCTTSAQSFKDEKLTRSVPGGLCSTCCVWNVAGRVSIVIPHWSSAVVLLVTIVSVAT